MSPILYYLYYFFGTCVLRFENFIVIRFIPIVTIY
jgi:hypothetical protein